VPWSEGELYRYLRVGYSPLHGVAAGPMAPVVQELGALPDADVRAMAHYLASFSPSIPDEEANAAAQAAIAAGQAAGLQAGAAQRMFTSACSACHHDGDGPRLLGVNTPLALNSNMHSARPDNLLRVILEGMRDPAGREIGFMPAFKGSLDDRQIAELAAYMRQRYAPGKPPWRDLEREVARVRREPTSP